jgi:predicted ATPase/DNA-binding SARP family transcriptional activator
MAADERIHVGVLGPLTARRGEAQLALGGSKQRALLALLALERGRTVATDALIEALWPQKPPGRPQTAIQGYVSHLRKALGQDAIITDASGYRLDLAVDALDSAEFEHMLTTAGKLAPAAKVDRLSKALALWRGPPLADFTYESWAQAEIARLEELRLAALESRLDAELACGRAAELVGELESLVQEHPLRERFRGQLMLALYRAGRQADALEAYAAGRSALVDELGIDPSPELQELHRSILNQESNLAADVQVAPTVRLPMPLTPLVGRDEEKAKLTRAFAEDGVRLLTLTGPGGVGKTRLAIEAAADLAPAFPDGVWFVELAPLREPEHVLPAISSTLDADGDLGTHIGARHMLLVLDNFEQVLEGAAPLAPLLSRSPRLSVLATSRERLHLSGEVEIVLRPLEQSDAAVLFVERAGRLGVDVDPEAREVADLCERLDGLPLAIELAAARTRLFSPEELLARLGNRLELLSADPLDAPARHRTLAATIEWSYALLNEGERELLEGLSVFAGAFDFADAESVLPTDPETLAGLIDKSLVVRRAGDVPRFGMLATVREFILSRLDERADADAIRQRHAEHVLAELERAGGLTTGPQQAVALNEIARRQDDLRVALDWAEAAGDGDLYVRLACAAGWYWEIRSHYNEGRGRLARALELSELQQTPLRAKTLLRAGGIADALVETEAADRYVTEALRIYRRLGDRQGEFDALNNLGNLRSQAGDTAEARRIREEALALARDLQDQASIAAALGNLALALLSEYDAASAMPLLEESLVHMDAVGDTIGIAGVNATLGGALLLLGEHEQAAARLSKSISLQREVLTTELLAPTLDVLAGLAQMTGDATTAARRLGAAVAIRTAAGRGVGQDEEGWAAPTESGAREELGDAAFEQAFDEGRRLSLADAFEFAEREAAAALAGVSSST